MSDCSLKVFFENNAILGLVHKDPTASVLSTSNKTTISWTQRKLSANNAFGLAFGGMFPSTMGWWNHIAILVRLKELACKDGCVSQRNGKL